MTKIIFKEILSWAMVIVIAIAIATVINRFVICKVSSPTPSMESTVMVDDKVVVFKLAYLFSGPKRGDIVVFEAPDEPDKDYIKRVIGLPGDKVEVVNGVVFINDEPIEEDYLNEPMTKENDGPFQVPKGHYFMMGDNRNHSSDAREWVHKYVARNKIKGKALLKYPNFKWLF